MQTLRAIYIPDALPFFFCAYIFVCEVGNAVCPRVAAAIGRCIAAAAAGEAPAGQATLYTRDPVFEALHANAAERLPFFYNAEWPEVVEATRDQVTCLLLLGARLNCYSYCAKRPAQ